MKTLPVCSLILSSALIAAKSTEAATPQKLPNVVIIYLDDMGYGDTGLTGALGYKTPHIDRMAREGMFFSHYLAPQAVCSASRAGILTGCYPNRIGFSGAIDHTSRGGIGSTEETIAQVLKKKNYRTAAFGKWHVGHLKPFLPLQKGFDEFYGIPYSHDMWPNHPTAKSYYPPLPLIEGNEVVQLMPDINRFTTDFTERALHFIEQNREHPFLVYLAHPLPHVPLAVSGKFRGKSEQGLYGDVMMEIDWSVGQILQKLDDLHLSENTLVIFTSDNGPWLNYGNHAGSSGGFREGKGTSFEGGQRVVCLMRWKGTIAAGEVCNKMISGIDILPTAAAMAGAPLPPNHIDGVNLLPLLQGDQAANPRTSFYYYYRNNSLEAVSNGNWKLVFPHNGRTYVGFEPGNDGHPGSCTEDFRHPGGLYDLRRDPGERYDVSASYPEVMQEMLRIAEEARDDLGDDLTGRPGKNRRPMGQVAE